MDYTVEQLREMCDKATPKPWQASTFKNTPRYARWSDEEKDEARHRESKIIRTPGVVGRPSCNAVVHIDSENQEDRAFVIAARTAMPELLDEVERMQDEVKRLMEENAELRKDLDRRCDVCDHLAHEAMKDDGERYYLSMAEVEGREGVEWK